MEIYCRTEVIINISRTTPLANSEWAIPRMENAKIEPGGTCLTSASAGPLIEKIELISSELSSLSSETNTSFCRLSQLLTKQNEMLEHSNRLNSERLQLEQKRFELEKRRLDLEMGVVSARVPYYKISWKFILTICGTNDANLDHLMVFSFFTVFWFAQKTLKI